jgi:hypothetical protein
MMTQGPNQKQRKRGKLKITQEDVVKVVMRIIDVKGLDAANAAFGQLNDCFSTKKGWAETADEVYDLLAGKRKEEKRELREEKLETQRAGAANIVMMNKNDLTGIGKVDQVNGVIEDGAEVTHTKHN